MNWQEKRGASGYEKTAHFKHRPIDSAKRDRRKRVPGEFMAKAMIITVGTGRERTDIAVAISLSVRRENPDYVLFLTSPVSERETFPLIDKATLENRKTSSDSFEEIDDVEEIYLHYLKIIQAVIADGYKREDIVIDYTSGTKSMSAALFAAGIALEVGSINYIAGKRDSTGRVIPGTERPIPIKPLFIFAENKIKEAKELFNRYQFQAAQVLLAPLKKSIQDPTISDSVDLLLKLTNAYAFWDTFRLKEASGFFGEIKSKGLINEHPAKDTFQKNFEFLAQSQANKYSIHRLIDLRHNVYRRMEEGKYDDAQARIYRLFEYMAQFKLHRDHNKIETERIKIGSLPFNIRSKYEKTAGGKQDIQLSMVKSFELLADLDDKLGIEFIGQYLKDNSTIRALLNKRNRSILAHGFTAIDRNDCEQLIGIAVEFLDKYFPEWAKEQEKAVFPKL